MRSRFTGGPGTLSQEADGRASIEAIELTRNSRLQKRAIDLAKTKGWSVISANVNHVTMSRADRRSEYLFVKTTGRCLLGRTVTGARIVVGREIP